MPLSQLLPDLTLVRDVQVSGLVMDSRAVRPGDAFVAIAGFGAHGLGFVAQARANGAVAVLFEPPAPAELPVPADAIAVPGLRMRLGAMADQFHGHPSRALRTVGVTGTNGKTSTVQLLAQALTLLGTPTGTLGTLGVGLYGATVPTGFTTPLVLPMHALLAQLREEGAQAVAMEVSSHALDQGRVDAVHFDVAVFTNLTRDHLDYHGDMAQYGAAKAKLFSRAGLKAAVVNLDDAFGRSLFTSLDPALRAVGVSSRGQAQAGVRAQALQLDHNGIGFALHLAGAVHPVHSPLLGRFNVDNLLAVAGALHALDYAPAQIAQVLGQLQPIHGRMNRLGGAHGAPLVVVDYAHTPDALEQALSSLRAHAQDRLICVFGCGGERDAGKRPQMAAIAEVNADVAIVTDDNPRGEEGDAIVADILRGFARPDAAIVQRDRAAAIHQAIGMASASDIVLIAGKGHEPYQEVAGVQHAFDDAVVAAQALLPRTVLGVRA
ncbi:MULTISPECIES: UDP-N-acetylmuramoyl-L-alanyl-D-glutamate--2,6-diaminopimelate ligase [Xanthomonas]|nr:UDP-N-acetylmuramoyl-L-alanyl-D-glutamate--2,6-diaminopimelate ligase [Xanthomonas cucurbitae]WDM69655.1 UDP-N-acetylmuramoyl-L-alanyl-D-glutamate--2,6-diaminopimelate ligase [Xanthomonas cucurbitae]WDM73529.1 UDP-N-acetylmuramoyl-L-alanyl-D-glutamate--2,6-diaminopimelate ligase [Xanthomonas cucurbitae]WDM77248.1 UDP-N-acetylmuramoyl-L-alanyl-D-glutamate--2,6-diaminopimelate ligase [Xanthomonas cucurbitae]WDM81075.1 UDP-N-acetylmuramoyl-L-alanyl-D-glutamate--2,6-diaminopimelate ligase [Xanth